MHRHSARAGFTLSVALLAWGATGSTEPTAPCADPVEHTAVRGHTTVVRCDGAENRGAALRGPARRLFGHKVDLNCSDPLTLQTLEGIGPARAQAIIDERSRGSYRQVEDLMRVRGIGHKTLARLRDELVVERGPISVESPGCRANS